MPRILFDDIIYRLQRYGGASVYWNNITKLVASSRQFDVCHVAGSKAARPFPVYGNADIFHSSHFRRPFFGSMPSVSTVHDLNYELGLIPQGLRSKLNIAERRLSYFCAQALICISASTKYDLLSIYPELEQRCPIHVIHHGCDFVQPTQADNLNARSIGPYILYVGGRKSYKCFPDLLEAFSASAMSAEGYRIVCTGSDFTPEEADAIAGFALTENVISLGIVSASFMAALYEQAYCLVYPSIHEGFGMPLVEAMQHGCPVIACNASCIPEIIGDAGLLVPPRSPIDIAACLLQLSSYETRLQFVKRGIHRSSMFTWDACVNAHIGVYRHVLESA